MASEPKSRSDAKRELRDRHKNWLQEIIRATGDKPSVIATNSGVSDSTLTRLLNNPDYEGTLSNLTIDRITARYKIPGPEEYAGGKALGLMGFAEAERFVAGDEPATLSRIVELMVGGRNNADPWKLKTDALEEAGYLAGDIVVVDLNTQPQPHDVVCAQVYDWKGGGAETVFRVYMPPFLVAAAHDRTAYKPLLVDQDRVVVKGVVVQTFRPHRLSATR